MKDRSDGVLGVGASGRDVIYRAGDGSDELLQEGGDDGGVRGGNR